MYYTHTYELTHNVHATASADAENRRVPAFSTRRTRLFFFLL